MLNRRSAKQLTCSPTWMLLPDGVSDIHDWRYDGRAWCCMDDGYYIHVMKRTIKVCVPKHFFAKPPVNPAGEMYRCWGNLLKEEYKLIDPRNGDELLCPHRDHYLVLPETLYEKWDNTDGY